jgi:hypothetical protein
MANPYLASVIAAWRREKKKRATVSKAPRSKKSHDIWGPPLKAKKPPAAPPDRELPKT